MNLNHFVIRAKDSGDKDTITEAEFRQLLAGRIDQVKMDYVINDIRRFIPESKVLAIWSPSYFHQLAELLKITVGA